MSDPILFSPEAEEAILGGLLTDPSVLSNIDLEPSDFGIKRNGMVFQALKRLVSQGVAIDVITVAEQLKTDGTINEIGGPSRLAKLVGSALIPFHIYDHAQIIKNNSRKRKGKWLQEKLHKLSMNGGDPNAIRETYDELGKILFDHDKTQKEEPVRKSRWTVDELLDAEFPEPRWAIPDIIPEGLTIFGGRPKVGKSFMMLQAAWSISTGGVFFDRTVESGNVLYLALEDSPRRLQKRLRDMEVPRESKITFEHDWRPLHKDGIGDLLVELETTKYRMVIVDTLTRAIPGIDQRKDQGVVGRIFDDLQRIAQNRNVAITMVDHTRKPAGMIADPIDDILNTTEKTAIADAILALYKEQGKAGAILKGRGRDFEDINLKLYWDAMTRCWQNDGSAGEIAITEQRNEILEALELLGQVQVGDIANATGLNKGNAHKQLVKLVEAGRARRIAVGRNIFYEKLETEETK